MIIIDTHVLIYGMVINENFAIPNDKCVHDKIGNILHIPDNGAIYRIFFSNGVTEESLNMACQFALNKVLKSINTIK